MSEDWCPNFNIQDITVQYYWRPTGNTFLVNATKSYTFLGRNDRCTINAPTVGCCQQLWQECPRGSSFVVSLLHIQLATSRAKKGCTAAPDVKQTKTRLHWSPSAVHGCFWRKSVFMWWEKSIKASPNIHSDRIKEKGNNKWCRDDIVIINWVFGGALISKCSTAVKRSLKCLND